MRRSILTALPVLTIAGCGTVAGTPEGATRRVSSPSPSVSASFDRAALAARVKAAVMAQAALAPVGGPATTTDDEADVDYATSDYCGLFVIGEIRSSHVTYMRRWAKRDLAVINIAHGYGNLSGSAAVESIRRNAQQCQSYEMRYSNSNDPVKFQLLEVVDLGQVAGVEATYGRCELRTDPGEEPQVACLAYLGRANLVSVVTVYHGATVASAKTKLRQVVPIAAAALVAVPA